MEPDGTDRRFGEITGRHPTVGYHRFSNTSEPLVQEERRLVRAVGLHPNQVLAAAMRTLDLVVLIMTRPLVEDPLHRLYTPAVLVCQTNGAPVLNPRSYGCDPQ